ncbi:MAG: hypothetical protein AAF558_05195, partial [Verrucomicrobiota bacterium]
KHFIYDNGINLQKRPMFYIFKKIFNNAPADGNTYMRVVQSTDSHFQGESKAANVESYRQDLSAFINGNKMTVTVLNRKTNGRTMDVEGLHGSLATLYRYVKSDATTNNKDMTNIGTISISNGKLTDVNFPAESLTIIVTSGGGTPPPPIGGGDVVEGEAMNLNNLEQVNFNGASGGKVVQVKSGNIGDATFTYNGSSGVKDIKVTLVDGSNSKFAKLYINGGFKVTWTLNSNDNSLRTFVYTTTEPLNSGDVIKVKLWNNEKLDRVEISGGALTVEGESMSLSNLEQASIGGASEGKVVKVVANQNIGNASYIYNGPSGVVDLKVTVYDGSGSEWVKLFIAGSAEKTWTLNANDNQPKTLEHSVIINDGEEIRIRLWGNEKLDKLEL